MPGHRPYELARFGAASNTKPGDPVSYSHAVPGDFRGLAKTRTSALLRGSTIHCRNTATRGRKIFRQKNFPVSAVFSAFIAALRLNWSSFRADPRSAPVHPLSSTFHPQLRLRRAVCIRGWTKAVTMQVPTEENEGNEGIYGGRRIFLQSSSVHQIVTAIAARKRPLRRQKRSSFPSFASVQTA